MKNTKAILLSDFDGRRDNNFTLIRIFFAWLVLYGHSYAIQPISNIKDPLNEIFQGSLWIGELAVNGFFSVSGFLVAASIIKRSLFDYTISRILRIYPALIVCILLSVFIVGPLFTTLSIVEYYSNEKTYHYLTNLTAFMRMEWIIPGLFQENNNTATNGSLWTLTVEVNCYLILAIIGFSGILKQRFMANIFLLALFLFCMEYYSSMPFIGFNEKWSRPTLYFLIGVAFYINRTKIIFDKKIFLLFLLISFSSFGEEWHKYIFPLTFSYLIFYTSYMTKNFNIDKVTGDISYGIYIYAFPIQQIIASLTPSGTPYTNTILSTIIVIPIAYISWHKIEKPMLSLKTKIIKIK